MNARVCLLALVTAAFMAIWDADRPAADRVAVAQSQLPYSCALFADVVSKSPQWVAAEHLHASQDNAAVSHSALATANSEAGIPLPTNLQPGTWQAISLDGDIFRITIECNRSLHGSTPINSRQ